MKTIAKMLGGSHAYGLNTPTSDLDERFVFLNTNIAHIIGLDKHENQVLQNEEKDQQGFELRRYLQLLRKTNTQVLEILFNENWLYLDKEFETRVLHRRESFLSTEHSFKTLMGYIQGEKRLMNGERSGRLGSKRKEAIETYGYSYKNLVQILRLTYVGIIFFEKQVYPVNIMKHNPDFGAFLLSIKTNPNSCSKDKANELVDEWEAKLKLAFDNRDKSKDFVFNETLANQTILDLYYPFLEDLYLSATIKAAYQC